MSIEQEITYQVSGDYTRRTVDIPRRPSKANLVRV